MGWYGYGIYGGDGTQTLHYDFIKKAKLFKTEDEIFDCLKLNRTILPKDKLDKLILQFSKIVSKLNKNIRDEEAALEWQMLASLYLDNKLKLPVLLKRKAKEATNYLMGDHADDFKNPSQRRRNLRRFMKKLESA